MHKYEIIIYWSNEDGAFVAETFPSFQDAQPTGTRRQLLWSTSTKPLTCGLKRRGNSATQLPEPKGERLMLA